MAVLFSTWTITLISSLLIGVIQGDDKFPEVCARSGCVTGLLQEGLGRQYEAFLGLPYARPPTKRYRFQVFFNPFFN